MRSRLLVCVLGGAAFIIAFIRPASAQPFEDSSAVPAWAYGAVAKLAADGFVQGYPDGTFRGDRVMTRDEMAVVVARVLGKIESIEAQLPASQRPQAGPRRGRRRLLRRPR